MKNSDLVRIIKDLFYKAEQAPSSGTASYCLDIAVSFLKNSQIILNLRKDMRFF